MLYTSETSAGISVTASSSAKTVAGDPELFAKELGSRVAEAAQNREKINATLEKMASTFPGLTVSTKSGMTTAEISEYHLKSGENASINISEEMLLQIGEDEETFAKVKEMLEMLFAAGNSQNLVNAGGTNVHRNVNIQGGMVQYVEVQRSANGTQLSVSSLTMENEKLITDTLDQLLGNRQQSQLSRNRTNNNAFTGILGSSAWRLQSFVSTQSLDQVMASIRGGGSSASASQQQLVAGQSFTASLEVVIEQWSAAGGSASGTDLMAYIEMSGLCDPLVLDLGDEGINLRSAEDGVYFDIKGDGSPVQTAFIQGNNAFLYLDGNGNGLVDDVSELFGDYGGYANGFEKLRQYDDNGDGVIDENDDAYHELRVWRDLNGDGVNQADESMTLAEAGVKSINLNYRNQQELDEHGNVIGERSNFTRTDGSQGLVADVWLRNR